MALHKCSNHCQVYISTEIGKAWEEEVLQKVNRQRMEGDKGRVKFDPAFFVYFFR
jgi:hypothetical protein